MESFKLAICQNRPGFNKQKNIEHTLDMIKTAIKNKAQMILLPEMFYYPYELDKLKGIADVKEDVLNPFIHLAKNHKVFICPGSIAEEKGDRVYNSSFLINPEGEIILEHSKCHLFDVNLYNLNVKESAAFTPGSSISSIETALGKIGILICYDIRFPDPCRLLAMQGIEILLVPAAFNTITGPAHWHITMRLRAIESQVFLAAASPARNNHSTYKAYGHSLIVDPWGKILKETGTGEKIIYADLDSRILKNVRERLPLLKHRRKNLIAKKI